VPDPYNPHNTALFIEDLFSFFPSTFVQVFKLCSRISSSHQKSVIISSVYHALLVTSTVSYIFLFWLSNFHIRLHMAIKLKLLPFALAWQLIVTTLHWSAVTTFAVWGLTPPEAFVWLQIVELQTGELHTVVGR